MEAERAKRSKPKVKDEADESSDAGEDMGGPNSDSVNELGQGNLISKFKAGPLIELWLTAVFELKGSSESCIRKSEVYERYLSYCRDNNIEATSTGAFGKILRRVFPTVECSRKGPRGHTKHYYKFFGPKAEPTPITPSQRMKALSQGSQQSQQIGGEKHPSLSSPYHSVGPTGPSSSSSSQSTKSSRTGSGPSSYPSPPHLSHPPPPPPPHSIKPEASMFSGPFYPPTAHSHHYMPATHPSAYPPSPHATTHPYLPEFHKTSSGRGGAEGFGVQSNNHNLNSNSGFMYAHPGPSSAAYLPHIKAETPPSPPYVSYGFSTSPIPPYMPGGFRSLAAHPMAPPYSLSSHPFFPSGPSSSHYPPSDSVVNVPSSSSASSSSSLSLASSSTTSRSPSPHSKRGSPSLSDTSFSNSSAFKSSSSSSSSSSGLEHSAAGATKKDSQAAVSSTTTVATSPSRETSDSPSSSSVATASSLASPTTLTGQSRPSPTSQPARSASPFSSTTPTLPPLPAFNPRLFSASPLLIPSATSPVSFTSMISSASPSFHAEMVAPHYHHIAHLPPTPTPRPSSSMSPFFGERHEGRESISPSIDLMSPSTSMFDSFRHHFSPYPLAGDFFIGDRESPITLPFPSPLSFLAQDKSKEENNNQAHPSAEEATSKQDSSLGSMHPPLKRPKPSHNPPIPFLKPSLPQPSSPSPSSSSSLAAAASHKKSSDKEAPICNTEERAEQSDRKESGLHNSSGSDSGEGSNRTSPSDLSLPSSDRIEGSERKHKRPRRSSSGKSKAIGSDGDDDEDDASGHSSAYKSGPHHHAEPDNNNERDKQGADHTPHTLGLSTAVTRPLLSRPDTSPFTPFSKKSAFNPGKSFASRRERREPLSPSSYSPGSPTSAFEATRPLSSATTSQSAGGGGGLHSHQHWSNAISQHRCPHFAFNLTSVEDELQQQLAMKEPSHNNKKEQKAEELAQLAKRFNGLYQRHLQQLFDAVASLQFNEIKSILFQFWSSAIEDFGALFQCQTINQQIKEVDEAMYNSLVVAILDNPFQPLASELSSMLMNFVVVYPVWLQKALQDVPASLRSKKLRGTVHSFPPLDPSIVADPLANRNIQRLNCFVLS
ncbi:Transcription factor rfx3, variant 2 [Balamuthia mandrillaris]